MVGQVIAGLPWNYAHRGRISDAFPISGTPYYSGYTTQEPLVFYVSSARVLLRHHSDVRTGLRINLHPRRLGPSIFRTHRA